MSMYSGMSAPEKTGSPTVRGILATYHAPVVCRKLGPYGYRVRPGVGSHHSCGRQVGPRLGSANARARPATPRPA